ncbi:MAG: RHS repeat-associated core domain-containing protein [Cyanobacteria bacterium TGS_CYA1]|nr:RHS repeat-associated core domain-containing protein [Cyanobacteria bacterium TGS_CYA1]
MSTATFNPSFQTHSDVSNANMTSDGTNTYAWDAENRLIQINYPGSGNNSQFITDPLGRNTKIVENTGGSPTSTKQFIWVSDSRCELRDSSGTVVRKYYNLGQMDNITPYYFNQNNLSSTVEVTDSSGTIVSTVFYDIQGQPQTKGSIDSDFQFCGYYFHKPSGLNLTYFRAYSSKLGRWLTPDPIEEPEFGTNKYCYCLNDPAVNVDPLGLKGYPNPIGQMAANLVMNHANEFQNNPAAHYYTCAIFVNACLRKSGVPLPPYPKNSVKCLCKMLDSNPHFRRIPLNKSYCPAAGDVITFTGHSGIVIAASGGFSLSFGGSTRTQNVDVLPFPIAIREPSFGRPLNAYRCCR